MSIFTCSATTPPYHYNHNHNHNHNHNYNHNHNDDDDDDDDDDDEYHHTTLLSLLGAAEELLEVRVHQGNAE